MEWQFMGSVVWGCNADRFGIIDMIYETLSTDINFQSVQEDDDWVLVYMTFV